MKTIAYKEGYIESNIKSETYVINPVLPYPCIFINSEPLYIYPTDEQLTYQWGCESFLIGTDAQSNTNGFLNTTTISEKCLSRPIAANVCDSFVDDLGFNDWYLPSKNEMTEILLQKENIFNNEFFQDLNMFPYWVSTEVNSDVVQAILSSGYFSITQKSSYRGVRCVRKGYKPINELLFSPVSGKYNTPIIVSIDTNLEDVDIYYTLNGDVPDTNSILYTAPFSVNESKVIKSIYVKDGLVSSVYISNYDISPLILPHVILDGNILYYLSPIDNYISSQWGCHGTAIGLSAQSITDGKTNTNSIVNWHLGWDSPWYIGPNGETCDQYNDGSVSVKICSDLNIYGYDDWYLPSKNQISTIANKINTMNLGEYRNEWVAYTDSYWTSTEISSNQSFAFSFPTKLTPSVNKYLVRKVRCIRD